MKILFPENYCRFCNLFFCCVSCRLKHERNIHNVDPNCNFCVYGRGYLKAPGESMLVHLKTQHWPLHCILCKTVFTTQRDLAMHIKCTGAASNVDDSSYNMIITSLSDINYDSPPITATTSKNNKQFVFGNGNSIIAVTTSTPMQKSNEPKELQPNISEGITSDNCSQITGAQDKCGTSIVSTKSQQTPISEVIKNTESSNRRVTFCETPIINYDIDDSSITDKQSEHFITASEELIQQHLVESVEELSTNYFSNPNVFEPNSASIKSQLSIQRGKEQQEIVNNSSEYNHQITENSNLEIFSTPELQWIGPSVNQEKSYINMQQQQQDSEIPIENKKIKSEYKPEEVDVYENTTEAVTTPILQESLCYTTKSPNKAILTFKNPKNEELLPTTETDNIYQTTFNKFQFHHNLSKLQSVSAPAATADEMYFRLTDKENQHHHVSEEEKVSTVDLSQIPEKQGIWFSMSTIVKNAVKNFSKPTKKCSEYPSTSKKLEAFDITEESKHNSSKISNKRTKFEMEASTEETPVRKRIKLSEVKCRKTIRHLGLLYLHKTQIKGSDKSTQTD